VKKVPAKSHTKVVAKPSAKPAAKNAAKALKAPAGKAATKKKR